MGNKALLTFEHVTIEAHPPYEFGLRDVTLALGPGELLLVRTRAGHVQLPLADAAEGLVDPDVGSVAFLGEDWRNMAPARAVECRSRIGRVFDGQGWISNLDADENITLAQRHHSLRPEEQIEREAEATVRSFGLAALPRVRPALLKRAELRRVEWARAFLGEALLVILEHPMRDVPADAAAGLVEAVQRVRSHGAAVLWVGADTGAWSRAPDGAVRRFDFTGAELVPLEGE